MQQVIACVNKVKDKLFLAIMLAQTSYNLYLYIK
nr:MAG TPA: hypothetical protein [Caudoviricetes sp.]